jgi:hypothetical protein
VAQVMVPQHFGDFRHAHGGAGVARIGFLHGIHRKGADGISEVGTCCHVFVSLKKKPKSWPMGAESFDYVVPHQSWASRAETVGTRAES